MQDWQDALLVYSTESGKIKPEPKEQARSVSSDGVVRIHRETKVVMIFLCVSEGSTKIMCRSEIDSFSISDSFCYMFMKK